MDKDDDIEAGPLTDVVPSLEVQEDIGAFENLEGQDDKQEIPATHSELAGFLEWAVGQASAAPTEALMRKPVVALM
jgi:hypothetical protein